MSMMKRQMEKLAERVTGDIIITDELMEIVEKHSIRQDTEQCWVWTNEHGNEVALANFIKNGCRQPVYIRPRNPVRLSSDANGKCWTIYNGG
jgi:hypothetical protein